MSIRVTPQLAAAGYLCLGVFGLFLSDVVLVTMVQDPALTSQIQTVKGGLEVLLTAAFIFVVMVQHERSLRTSVELGRERAQELAVLHRVFRHNLRNKVNVILGHAQQAKREVSDQSPRDRLDVIIDQTTAISKTAEQAVLIQQLSFLDDDDTAVDVVPLLEELAREYETKTDTVCELTAPDSAWVVASGHAQAAFDELFENAVVHNDAPQCRIRVTVAPASPTGAMTHISIADNGPGIPTGTQEILESTDVDPRNHLTTFGLWTAYWILTRGDGAFSIEDNEPRGTIVDIRLPSTTPDG